MNLSSFRGVADKTRTILAHGYMEIVVGEGYTGR